MKNKKKKEERKAHHSLLVFLILVLILLGISVFSYFFFKQLNISENGFLDMETLKLLGFWDERPNRYDNFWYPNGHLHPLYVLTTLFFEKCYLYNLVFVIIVLIFTILTAKFKRNIAYNKFIFLLSFISFVINMFIFVFAAYYFVFAKGYPININFYIFLGNTLVYLCILIFYFSHKKKPHKKLL